MHKTIHKIILSCVAFGGLFCMNTSLEARNPYHADIVVGAESARFSESTILNLIEDLETISIQRRIAVYTSNSAASLFLNLRGLIGIASYAANSTALTISIPQAGISETFVGATREESNQLFDEFIKNDPHASLNLRKAHAKYTAIDPIAGNPNSLMSLMTQADYLLGRLSPLAGCDYCWTAQPIHNQFQAGIQTGWAFCDEFTTSVFTLPLRYTYSRDLNYAFIIDAPQTFLVNGRAVSYNGSLATGLRVPITHEWSLTTIFRGGLGLSGDLSTAGIFASAGMVSDLDFKFCDYVLTMDNYVGYIVSTPFHAGGVNFDYHLYNFVFKNGLTLTSCNGFTCCGAPMNFNLTFTDTAFTGSSLFIDHYDEVTFSLVTTRVNPYIGYDSVSIGGSYQFGHRNYKGYTLNFIYQF